MQPGDRLLVCFYFYDGPENGSHFEEARGLVDRVEYGPSGEITKVHVSRISDGYKNTICAQQFDKRLKK